MGRGKKWEGTLSFPFPFLKILTPFFPIFGSNREKRVKKGRNNGKKAGKMWTETAGPFLFFLDSRIWRDAVFLTVQNPFLPYSKPVFAPSFSRSSPSFSRCWSFFYCLPIISKYAPLPAQPLDHVRPSLVRGTSWRFVFMATRC